MSLYAVFDAGKMMVIGQPIKTWGETFYHLLAKDYRDVVRNIYEDIQQIVYPEFQRKRSDSWKPEPTERVIYSLVERVEGFNSIVTRANTLLNECQKSTSLTHERHLKWQSWFDLFRVGFWRDVITLLVHRVAVRFWDLAGANHQVEEIKRLASEIKSGVDNQGILVGHYLKQGNSFVLRGIRLTIDEDYTPNPSTSASTEEIESSVEAHDLYVSLAAIDSNRDTPPTLKFYFKTKELDGFTFKLSLANLSTIATKNSSFPPSRALSPVRGIACQTLVEPGLELQLNPASSYPFFQIRMAIEIMISEKKAQLDVKGTTFNLSKWGFEKTEQDDTWTMKKAVAERLKFSFFEGYFTWTELVSEHSLLGSFNRNKSFFGSW